MLWKLKSDNLKKGYFEQRPLITCSIRGKLNIKQKKLKKWPLTFLIRNKKKLWNQFKSIELYYADSIVNKSTKETFSPFKHHYISGLGIRSSVFRANRSFFVSERAKEWFAREKEGITPVALLSWVTGVNHLLLLFCKEWQEREELRKTVKNIQQIGFSSKSLVLWEQLASITKSRAICSRLLFCKVRRERFAHGCSL